MFVYYIFIRGNHSTPFQGCACLSTPCLKKKKKEEPWVLSDAVRISFQEVHILYITCAISLQQTDILES